MGGWWCGLREWLVVVVVKGVRFEMDVMFDCGVWQEAGRELVSTISYLQCVGTTISIGQVGLKVSYVENSNSFSNGILWF